jgi:hypothetical protein
MRGTTTTAAAEMKRMAGQNHRGQGGKNLGPRAKRKGEQVPMGMIRKALTGPFTKS